MTGEERRQIQEAACRYVHEQAPTPPRAVLERVARIVLEARSPRPPEVSTDLAAFRPGQLGAA
jgi:hypothetical protein